MKKIAILILPLLVLGTAKGQMLPPVQKSISVTGTADTTVTPDEIYIQVELREYDKKNGGKIDIGSIKNDFLSACKDLGLADSDVVVQSYSGWDGNYWWYQKNKKKNPDMKAGITYWVKVNNLSLMDQLVSKLDDEATQNFFIAKTDYSRRGEMERTLRMSAIRNARDKASYLCAAINEQLGGALTITEPGEGNGYSQPVYSAMMLKNVGYDQSSGEPAMNISFKKISLSCSENVVFAIK